jgi:gamma-glutamyltranspeptidase
MIWATEVMIVAPPAAGLRLVVGTPGGATIITSVAQIIAGHFERALPLAGARQVRIGHSGSHRHEVEVRQLVVQQEPVAGPTIITDAAGLRLVVGTPGGATIITSVAQIIAGHFASPSPRAGPGGAPVR